MQVSNVKRIIVEDFPKEDRETVSKLASILNQFMDETVELSRKNVDFDNLKRSKIALDVTLDANGIPQGAAQIKIGLTSYSGKNIVDVQNLQGGANVISSPYLDCTYQGNGIVKINKFHGLPLGVKLRITVEFIG